MRSGEQKAKEKVAEENARSRQEVAEDAATVTALRAEVEQLRVRESEAAGQVILSSDWLIVTILSCDVIG